jgi:hypothetical protein
MTPSAVAIVFGNMSGIFAASAGNVVQWTIENYAAIYNQVETAKFLIFARSFFFFFFFIFFIFFM